MTHLVGGISSAGRGVPEIDGVAFQAVRAEGAHLWDTEGRVYIDHLMAMGATVLGHAPAEVVAACIDAMHDGPMPGVQHPREEQAAAALAARCGELSKVLFLNSGSEAVALACRAARALTGRPRIAKFAAAYDGWFDDIVFGSVGAPESAMDGNARPMTARTALLRYNDFDDIDRLFADCPDIAGVLIEPMLANAGCIAPAPGFMEQLVATARRHGALVIADEVMMGFRTRPGLATHGDGLDPDLATVGKAIGSGTAVAALVGRPGLMAGFTDGRIGRRGTYSGNPVACAAVTATMKLLGRLDYPAMLARGERLRAGLVAALRKEGHPASSSGHGSVFTLWLSETPPTSYAATRGLLHPRMVADLHVALRRRFVMATRADYGRYFVTAAHDDADIDHVITAFAAALGALR
jgi:glutamate-1-semialdehyde 2,1-aminomutase